MSYILGRTQRTHTCSSKKLIIMKGIKKLEFKKKNLCDFLFILMLTWKFQN